VKNLVLYITFIISLGLINGYDSHFSSITTTTTAEDRIDKGSKDQLSKSSSDQTIIKKKRTRIRHADEWGRIEPEQSFQKSFDIQIGCNSVSEIHFSSTLLSVNGKRGPPVI
jgi:hypothetical protein